MFCRMQSWPPHVLGFKVPHIALPCRSIRFPLVPRLGKLMFTAVQLLQLKMVHLHVVQFTEEALSWEGGRKGGG